MKILNIKLIGILIVGLLMFSCEPPKDEQAIKTKIENLKKEAKAIQDEIDLLSSQIVDSTAVKEITEVPVGIKTMAHETFNHYFEANGSVEALNDAIISPQMSGQISKIHVKEGERVSKGRLLISLDTQIIDGSIDELKNGLELAKKIYNKQKSLWDQNIGSEIQFLEAKNSKESLEKKLTTLRAQKELSLIRAPFSGVIDEIFVKKGELASPGFRVLQLVNLDKLLINAELSEAYLSKIEKGENVEVSFPAYPELKLDLPVTRIGNVVNVENRTFKIEVKLNNKDEMLKPNVLSVLKINDFSTDTAFVVPSIIIKQDIKGSFLYLAKEEDGKQIAKKTYITPGVSYQNMSSVISGLNMGDKVIVSGYNMLSNGISINEVK